MPGSRSLSVFLSAALLALPLAAPPAGAEGPELVDFGKPPRDSGAGDGFRTATYYDWMHSDVSLAWRNSLYGEGTTITVVDDFSSNSKYFGNLGDGLQRLRHGEWTHKEAGMISTRATMVARDYVTSGGEVVSLDPARLDVLNLSYGYLSDPGEHDEVITDTLQASVVAAAWDDSALVSKAAGNQDGDPLLSPDSMNRIDILARDLIGAPGVLFVGALEDNGSTDDKAAIASYSTVAGGASSVVGGVTYYARDQFLVVGVESGMTGLAGTSFAAPIVSAYGAILANKFADNNPSPGVVADQLLKTARTDTIVGYDSNIHGMGEASLANALAPLAIK